MDTCTRFDWTAARVAPGPTSHYPAPSMARLAVDKVEVYVFRRRSRRVQFLALRRAPRKTLPGVWQPVTGKIERRETPIEAAWRETLEETGLEPTRLWRLETTTLCLDARGRTLMALPLFAAEVAPRQPVQVSSEHDAARFVDARTAARLYLWDSQRQGLAAVARQILARGARAAALELVPPRRPRTSPSHVRRK